MDVLELACHYVQCVVLVSLVSRDDNPGSASK
jgi:hypothetical protein